MVRARPTCACGCGAELRGRARRYASKDCLRRHYSATGRLAGYLRRYRHEARGRVCRVCARTDAETIWSGSPDLCLAHHRRGERNGVCSACRHPMSRRDGAPACTNNKCDAREDGRCPDRLTTT